MKKGFTYTNSLTMKLNKLPFLLFYELKMH